MNVPAHNVMHALRRFVGLRSAWRRSLAMEPGVPVERTEQEPREPREPRAKEDCPGKRCCQM